MTRSTLFRLFVFVVISLALSPGGGHSALPPALGTSTADTGGAESIRPTALQPFILPADAADQRAKLHAAIAKYMAIPAEDVKPHPAAADFPGEVMAGAQPIHREVDVALNLPRWHSTGLYAAPGAAVTIRVSPEDARRGLAIVIGCHTDNLEHLTKWVRFPRVSRKFEITATTITVANAFGGLVYIDVPRDPSLGGYHFETYGGYGWLNENPATLTAKARISIDGAVEAPLFELHKTTPSQWHRMQQLGAPWGELACGRIILTLKTENLKFLDDPTALMEFWEKIVDTEARLAGWPHQPAPPERIVLDRDISAGFMHSGYPIMAHLTSGANMINIDTLKTKGDWGFFHELGHNHEGQAYTFGSDYVEVDVNLFSMYVMQKLVGREMTAHNALRNISALLDKRLGPDKKDDAWGNLAMYIVTIQAFGWEPLEKTLAGYSLPGGAVGIKTRQQKIDQWVLRYSKATGKNLAGYYDLFGIQCDDAIRQQLKDFPTWIPAELQKYAAK